MKNIRNQAGMTLIEIMVVVAIIAGITGIVAVNVIGSSEKAKIQTTKTQISNLMSALDQYKLDNYKYPSSEQGLDALANKPSGGTTPKNYPEGGYMKKIPNDSWGNDFNYSSPGANGNPVEISSNGPDGEPDTADDIKSWETDAEEE